jgi:hypothetical protein
VSNSSSSDEKTVTAIPRRAFGAAQQSPRAASAEERRNKRIEALDGQQAELKRQAQERREQRDAKSD